MVARGVIAPGGAAPGIPGRGAAGAVSRGAGVPGDVLTPLGDLKEKTYDSEADLVAALGRVLPAGELERYRAGLRAVAADLTGHGT